MEEKRVFNNAKWIIICKIAQSVIQLIVGMLCARYLGPANYGLINYASSIVAFATPLMRLGFDSTLVRELIEDPDKEGEIMGTSLLMNVCSSAACILAIAAFVLVVNAGERVTIIVSIVYSLSLFFAALEMIQYWFQYKLLSKYSSMVMLIAYVIVSFYKIFLLISAQDVYWFALTNSIDYGVIGISLILIYRKKSGQRFRLSAQRAKKLFRTSKYYIFASLMVVVYHNTDHIMLTTMIGEQENGFYSAAITSATVAQFVFTAIIDSFRPLVLSSQKESAQKYERNVARLYGIITYLTLAQAVVFSLLAKTIIDILYGAEYLPAIPILRILVWYVVFSVMGSVRNVWILAEEKQRYLPWINLSGAVLNIILNACLIPVWGACGAAFASFVTQVVTNFVLGFVFKPLRLNNKLLLRGINPVFVKRELVLMLQEFRKNK